mmetsp:Transcript_20526/g.61109  ORF Transcript_20526/g.61109 Transcript_20526/m.61109 type:complete len:268 (+) Transcript_20526:1495-2298(+)
MRQFKLHPLHRTRSLPGREHRRLRRRSISTRYRPCCARGVGLLGCGGEGGVGDAPSAPQNRVQNVGAVARFETELPRELTRQRAAHGSLALQQRRPDTTTAGTATAAAAATTAVPTRRVQAGLQRVHHGLAQATGLQVRRCARRGRKTQPEPLFTRLLGRLTSVDPATDRSGRGVADLPRCWPRVCEDGEVALLVAVRLWKERRAPVLTGGVRQRSPASRRGQHHALGWRGAGRLPPHALRRRPPHTVRHHPRPVRHRFRVGRHVRL